MTDVQMPQMGESIVEGTLTKWLKKPGERVERDEPLFEISTDKVDTEIPSPAAGTLAEVLIEEGKTVGINTVVARIDEGGGAAASKPASAAAPPKAPPQPETPSQETIQPTVAAQQQVEDTAPAPGGAAPEPAAPAAAEPVGPISPLVRKMARENNLDLSKVKGSGAGGRITKQDMEAYLSQPQAAAPAAPAAPPARPAAPAAPAPVAPVAMPAAGGARTRIEPLSTM